MCTEPSSHPSDGPHWQTDRVQVSLVQFAAATDADANLETISRLVRQAQDSRPAREDDQLVVLPEAAMHDFGPVDLALGPTAQRIDGPFVAGLARLARQADATIVAGMFETSDDPARPYNTVVVVGPGGDVLGRYRKIHLYDSFGERESDRLTAGDGVPVVLPVAGLSLGLLTCYDLRFPELARALVDDGADTLVVPAAWLRGPLKEDHWTTLLRARAIENTTFVLAAGQCGSSYIGATMAVDPSGVVLAACGPGEGVVAARVERSVVDEVRRRNPSLANRREPRVR
ncbi:MAG: carbon-nitrogen hydrolase family protein [Nocardioidaceae bacterium]